VATNRKKTNNRKKLYIVIIIIILVIAAFITYEEVHKKPATKIIVTGTKSTPATAPTQSSVPSSTTTPSTTNNGGATDNNGQTTGTLPPSSQWSSSSNGDITLQQPTNASTIKSGDTISGIANTSTVSFILKDNQVGVIAQGNLDVVNGKFSGTLQFTSHGSTGSLEVYYSNPQSGAEEDTININVNYGS